MAALGFSRYHLASWLDFLALRYVTAALERLTHLSSAGHLQLRPLVQSQTFPVQEVPPMTPQSVVSLIAEIEAEDRLDFGDLSLCEEEARSLMANHFCELDRKLAEHGLGTEARLEVMAAIAAHTMVENMILYLGQLRSARGKEDFRAWMRRHGLS